MATPTRRSLPLAAAILLTSIGSTAGTAHADTRGVFRIGITPVDLATTEDTPLLGEPVGDAVKAYNAAADAYNQVHGYEDGSAMAESSIDRGDLGVRADLFTFSPALEVGNRYYFFRLEGAIGAGDGLRSYGVGVYPVNLSAPLRQGSIVPYLSAGGAASWLDRTAVDGEVGGLLTARAALGVRVQRRMTIEVGYGAFVLGGLADRGKIKSMTDFDPRGDTPPPSPSTAIAGGEQRGLVDVSIGLALE